MAAGEIAWIISAQDGFSGIADTLYLLGYVAMCGAMVVFARRHSAGIGSILDASILTAAAASILWMLVIEPTLADISRAPAEALLATAYPLADIVMIGLLLLILLDRQGSNPALLLFASGVGAFLVSDLIYSVIAVQGNYTVGPLDFGWIMGYTLWGAAALHPSMAARVVRGPADGRISNRRLAALAVVSLVPLLIAVAEQLRHGAVEPMPAIIASAVMFMLVVARLSGVVRSQRSLIDERTRMQGALERLSVEDALTGLSNRRGFSARLADALLRDARQVAVVCLDLDDFKVVNDSLGHPVGDAVLAAVAQRLRGHIRSRDTVARLGGDEFAVLIEGNDPAQANVLAERIEAALQLPYDAAPTMPFSASVGVAHSVDVGTEVEAVLAAADISMFTRKREQHRARGLGAETGSGHAEEHL